MTDAELEQALKSGQFEKVTNIQATQDDNSDRIQDLENSNADNDFLLGQLRNHGSFLILAGRMYSLTQTTIPTATETKIIFDNIDFQKGIQIDKVNYRMTVPAQGYYKIAAQVTLAFPALNQVYQVEIRVNGTIRSRNRTVPAGLSDNLAFTANDVLSLNAGDYVEVWMLQQSGASQSTYNGSIDTFFSLYKIN